MKVSWAVIRDGQAFMPIVIVTDHGNSELDPVVKIRFSPMPTYQEARSRAKGYARHFR